MFYIDFYEYFQNGSIDKKLVEYSPLYVQQFFLF